MNLFYIPELNIKDNKEIEETTLIGIIDASGSMNSYWPHMVKIWNEISNEYKNTIIYSFS